jgi:hypothetical protein
MIPSKIIPVANPAIGVAIVAGVGVGEPRILSTVNGTQGVNVFVSVGVVVIVGVFVLVGVADPVGVKVGVHEEATE